MAEDTYPEELYIQDWDVYDYDPDLWNELMDTIALEDEIESDREDSGDYDAEWYGREEEPEEIGEGDYDARDEDDDFNRWFERE